MLNVPENQYGTYRGVVSTASVARLQMADLWPMPDLMDMEARWETKGPAWAEPGRRQQLIE